MDQPLGLDRIPEFPQEIPVGGDATGVVLRRANVKADDPGGGLNEPLL